MTETETVMTETVMTELSESVMEFETELTERAMELFDCEQCWCAAGAASLLGTTATAAGWHR